jgi:hypothetical protein
MANESGALMVVDISSGTALALVEEFSAQLFDGPYLRIKRKLLREGLQPRGDRVFEVKTLRPHETKREASHW